MCLNPAALEMMSPTGADHGHWDFGRRNEQTHATHEKNQGIIYSTLTVEMTNSFVIAYTITLQFSKTNYP